MKKILYAIIRIFRQSNKGFSPRKTLKEIKKDKARGKEHYSDEGGELAINLGASLKKENPGGHWASEGVIGEIQKNRFFDTYGCTVFDTENGWQILMMHKYGIFEEYTERYNGVLANIKIGFGGSPHTAAETYRKYGALKYDLLPFDDTIKTPQQYYSPKPMTKELIVEGKKWLKVWKFGHDWFWNFTPKNMMNMLEYSPLGIGVYAWTKNKDGIYYKPNWAKDNHWSTIIDYVENEYWIVYDSYEVDGTFIKKLDWNYPFAFAKRYTLDKIGSAEVAERSVGEGLIKDLKKRGIKYIQVVSDGAVYEILGDDLIYHFWATDSETFFQVAVDKYIREMEAKGELVGVTPENFEAIKNYVVLSGGVVKVDEATLDELKGLLLKLKV